MNKDLGFDSAIYGMAAGFFFWGYVLVEVPSNIILEKIGARLWIARIMVTWGIFAGATAYAKELAPIVTAPLVHLGVISAETALAKGPQYSFMLVRFLLGLAEAGLFPGFVLYFTYWFPRHHRARINSGFTLALPIAVALGAPFSTALLGLDGLFGLKSWQIMYVFEAIPTVLIGVVVFFYLTERPEVATWLTPEQKKWLASDIAAEKKEVQQTHNVSVWRSFWDPRVVLLSINYLGIVTASLGMLLFLPQIVKQLGVSNMEVGWVTMIPYGCGAISMVIFGRISDRLGDRRWTLFWTCLISVVGLIIAGLSLGTWWALVGMTIAAIGFYGTKGPFWSIPSMWLTGSAAAAGIAWINSIGNLGGFFGPTLVGWAKNLTGSFAGGLYALAVCSLISAIVSLFWIRVPKTVPSSASATAVAAAAE